MFLLTVCVPTVYRDLYTDGASNINPYKNRIRWNILFVFMIEPSGASLTQFNHKIQILITVKFTNRT